MASLATAYVSIVADTKRIAPDVRKALGESEKAAVKSGSSIGDKLSSGMKKTLKGGMLAAGGVAAAAFGKALTGGFARLDAIEQAKVKFAALGHTAKEQASLIQDVTAAVKGTAFSTSEAADAAAMALAAGIKPGKDLSGVLSTIGDSASFANKNFAEVAPIFTKAINKGKVMGDTLNQLEENAIPATQSLAKHLGKTAEEIQSMASKGQISFRDLQEAMDAAIGGQAKKSGETFTGGFKNMNAALSRLGETILSTPFKMGPQIFSAIGSALDDVNIKLQGVFDYLNNGDANSDIFTKAFGTGESAAGIISTLDDIKVKWGEFTAGLRGDDEDATGIFGLLGSSIRSIGEAIMTIMPSVTQIMLSLGEAGMKAAVVSLTTAFATLAPLLADVLAPVLQTLATLMSENQGAVNALVLAFVGLSTANAAAGAVGGFVGKVMAMSSPLVAGKAKLVGMVGGFKTFSTNATIAAGKAKTFGADLRSGMKMGAMGRDMRSVSGVTGKFGVALGNAGKFARQAAVGMKAFTLSLLANPITWIVVAIAALVTGLTLFFTKTETGKRIWSGFVEALKVAWEGLGQAFRTVYDTFIAPIFNLIKGAFQGLVGIFTNDQDLGSKLAESLGLSEDSAIIRGAVAVRDKVAEFVEGVKEKWADLVEKVSPYIDTFKEKFDQVKQFFSDVWAKMQPIVEEIKAKFAEIFSKIGDAIAKYWEPIIKPALMVLAAIIMGPIIIALGLVAAAIAIFVAAIAGIAYVLVSLPGWIADAWNTAKEWIVSQWDSFWVWVSEKWASFTTPIVNAWNSIYATVTNAWNIVSAWVTTKWNLFLAWVNVIWQNVYNRILWVWLGIKVSITNTWNSISSWVTGAWNTFTSFATTTFNNIRDRISEAWQAVQNKIYLVWDNIKTKVAEAVAFVVTKLQEFVTNTKQKFTDAVNAMKEFPTKVKNVFVNAGRWLFDAGKRIIQGLIDGIKSMVGLVAGAVRSVIPGFAAGAIGLSDGAAYANGGVTRYASGGREKHVAQIAKAGEWRVWAEDETGGEAYIPLAKSKRRRSTAILADVAQRFGLNLTDRDGAKVSSYTPGGTGPVAGAVQRFADGGIRTKRNFLDFAHGEEVDGQKASGSLNGAPYQNYPSDPNAWGDCSYAMGKFAAFALGLATSGRKFSTVSQLNWLQANGANIGRGPDGTFRMGWYDNGGGQFGHTSGTLPDGTNVEMGGSAGGGKIGGSAVGWDWSRYTHHAWIPAKTSEGAGVATGESDIPVAGTAVDANMVEVPSDTASKVESAGMDTSDDLPSSWSEFAGNVAKDVVSGQVEDVLNVFGIKNELPPIMKAGKTLFVKTDEDDPTGEKAIDNLDAAADAKIAADGAIEAEGAKPAEDEVKEVPAGSVSMGAYKLGMDFYLEEVARAAAERRMGFKAAKLATAAMLVEVGDPLKMYASSVDTASQKFPYEAIGSDHDSSGLFQQRNNGAWGTIEQRMNARGSASMFLNALKKVAGWETMEEGAAVQAVQRSAFPSRYSAKMARAEELMSRFRGKLPGFKNGGMIRGGKSRIKDDVLAMLQNGEYVINRDSVNAYPEMAEALNSGGPQAVVDMVLNQAAGAAAAGAGGAATAGIGGAAGLLNTVAPGMGAPVAAMAGPAAWYAEQVAGGVAGAFATAGSQIFSIGMSRIESVASAFGIDYGSNVAAFASPAALSSAFADGVDRVESRRTGGGDTYNFIAQDMSGMHSAYRREQAKANRGKVGAR